MIKRGLTLVNALNITPRILINDAAGPEAGCTTVLAKPAVASLCPGRRDNADVHLKRQVMGREVVVCNPTSIQLP
jgi:hypothetical protein